MKRFQTNWPMTIPRMIQNRARCYGHRAAIIQPGRRISYSDLFGLSAQLAAALRARGLEPGQRVAVVLPDGWQFLVAVCAVIMADGIVVPLDFAIRPLHFHHVMADCQAKALIVDDAVMPRLESAIGELTRLDALLVKDGPSARDRGGRHPAVSLDAVFRPQWQSAVEADHPTDPDSVVSITYTSGSTGRPKGVMHSHASWLQGAAFTGDYFELSGSDKMMIPLPLHHAYSFRHVLAYWLEGGTVVLAKDLYQALMMLPQEKPNALLLVPAACNLILKYFRNLVESWAPFLDVVSIGTAAMPTQQLRDFQTLLPRTAIHLPYGLTEARVGFLRLERDSSVRKLCSLSPGLDVRVVTRSGQLASRGETGQIVIKGEGLMAGYWKSTDADRREIRERGFPTGDLGRLADDGEIILLGRADDVINVGGRKVYPYEIEGLLKQHPSVFDAVVVGAPDPGGVMGAVVRAIIVRKKGETVSADELIRYCKKALEPYKVPTSILFESWLQKTSLGKARRGASPQDMAAAAV